MMLEDFSRDRMRQLMEERDITAYKMAKLSGFPKSTIGNYIQGRSPLNIIFLEKFCKVLGITILDFYEGYK